MVDRDIMTSRLGDLAGRIGRVRLHCPPTVEDLAANQDALDLVSFNLLLAIQACLDVASHLIADGGWQPATTSAGAFQRLREQGVISKAWFSRPRKRGFPTWSGSLRRSAAG